MEHGILVLPTYDQFSIRQPNVKVQLKDLVRLLSQFKKPSLRARESTPLWNIASWLVKTHHMTCNQCDQMLEYYATQFPHKVGQQVVKVGTVVFTEM